MSFRELPLVGVQQANVKEWTFEGEQNVRYPVSVCKTEWIFVTKTDVCDGTYLREGIFNTKLGGTAGMNVLVPSNREGDRAFFYF